MAKDDYYVIAYKILAYLYVQLKAGDPVDAEMLAADSPLLQINKKYWAYILENLANQGYIRDITITKASGHQTFISNLEDCEITPDGIAYVCDNSLFNKVKQFLKDTKEITPFI